MFESRGLTSDCLLDNLAFKATGNIVENKQKKKIRKVVAEYLTVTQVKQDNPLCVDFLSCFGDESFKGPRDPLIFNIRSPKRTVLSH